MTFVFFCKRSSRYQKSKNETQGERYIFYTAGGAVALIEADVMLLCSLTHANPLKCNFFHHPKLFKHIHPSIHLSVAIQTCISHPLSSQCLFCIDISLVQAYLSHTMMAKKGGSQLLHLVETNITDGFFATPLNYSRANKQVVGNLFVPPGKSINVWITQSKTLI